MKSIVVLTLIAGLGWLLFFYQPKAGWKGLPANAQPIQTTQNLPAAIKFGDFLLKPLATYSITGVVVSTQRYRYDGGAEVAPIDVGLAWGPMSNASVLNELSISQNGRFLEFSYKNEPPLDQQSIDRNCSNTHCIPASKDVKKQLFSIQRHEIATMEGYLVEVFGPKGFSWRSSLSREDTRGGACEVMYVTKVIRRKIKQ